jgi:hypothetical protein
MKEILQLFRRDAENAAPFGNDMSKYDLGNKPRILEDREMVPLQTSMRETSLPREKKNTPTSATLKEDSVYGRRW